MNSHRAFLSNLIDYAGLFPPANLSLDQAIHNYAAYQRGRDSWMLGRFILPAKRLPELESYINLFDNAPLRISALGRASQSAQDFLIGLEESLTQIKAFRERNEERVAVEVIELPLPKGTQVKGELLEAATHQIEKFGLRRLSLFYEVNWESNWSANVQNLLEALALPSLTAYAMAGFKLRCGGTLAETFPTTEQVALALTATRDFGVAMKCTAGLHHPIRRYDESVKTRMHGFVNVFGAGSLAQANNLTASQVQAILEDEEASHFQFDATGLRWHDLKASTEVIAAVRQSALLSFGSCSFDEPLEDLRTLGWL